MQVYRGMDVGTAKPTPAERAEVRHHLIDVVDPDQPFTVARFVEMADDGDRATRARAACRSIATGGTPLYYKALFEGLFGGPGADEDVRARLRRLPRRGAAPPAQRGRPRRRRADSRQRHEAARPGAGSVRADRPADLVVPDGMGRSRSSGTPAMWVGLSWDKEALNRRINARVKAMIAAGWVDEVRGLLARYRRLSHTAAEATGYRELIEHLRGELPLDEAVERIKIATRQLARRQMKWFRRFPGVTWPGVRPGRAKVPVAGKPSIADSGIAARFEHRLRCPHRYAADRGGTATARSIVARRRVEPSGTGCCDPIPPARIKTGDRVDVVPPVSLPGVVAVQSQSSQQQVAIVPASRSLSHSDACRIADLVLGQGRARTVVIDLKNAVERRPARSPGWCCSAGCCSAPAATCGSTSATAPQPLPDQPPRGVLPST